MCVYIYIYIHIYAHTYTYTYTTIEPAWNMVTLRLSSSYR